MFCLHHEANLHAEHACNARACSVLAVEVEREPVSHEVASVHEFHSVVPGDNAIGQREKRRADGEADIGAVESIPKETEWRGTGSDRKVYEGVAVADDERHAVLSPCGVVAWFGFNGANVGFPIG